LNAFTRQAAFAGWLRHSPSVPGQAGALPVNGVDASRLAIHRNNFVASLVDAMAEAFPVTQAIVGDAFFRTMARQRVLADPPRSPMIAGYSDGFARFVAEYPAAAAVPFLAPVAQLERLCLQAFHAADATSAAREDYEVLCNEPARLGHTCVRLHPSVRWMRSRYAIYSLWAAHQGLADMSAADLGGIESRRPEAALVARPALDVVVVLLPVGACDFLDALMAGASLETAMNDARAGAHDADPTALFSLLVRYGLAIEFIDNRKEFQ